LTGDSFFSFLLEVGIKADYIGHALRPLNQKTSMSDTPKTKTDAAPDQSACPAESSETGEHWRYCLRCGHELINEKCKLRCPRCHYFMSCSDFDFAT